MKLIKTLGLAAVVAGSLSVASYAGGIFQGWPIVGSAAFCDSTNSQSTSNTVPGTLPSNSNCTTTVPAGPSIVTGNELIAADTNLANGAAPQTVRLSMASMNALPITVSTINTASQTVAASATSGGVFLHLASGQGAAMTAVTIDFPTAPIDGQQFIISGDASVTTLTLTALNLPANVKISLAPTGMTAVNSALFGFEFVYSAALNQWGRLQ